MLTPNGALPTSNGAFRCLVQLLSADNKASSDRAELYFSMSRRPPAPAAHRKVQPLCIVSIKETLPRSSQSAPNRPPPPFLPAAAAATLFTADDVMARCIQPPSTRFSRPRQPHEPCSAHVGRAKSRQRRLTIPEPVADESRTSPYAVSPPGKHAVDASVRICWTCPARRAASGY